MNSDNLYALSGGQDGRILGYQVSPTASKLAFEAVAHEGSVEGLAVSADKSRVREIKLDESILIL